MNKGIEKKEERREESEKQRGEEREKYHSITYIVFLFANNNFVDLSLKNILIILDILCHATGDSMCAEIRTSLSIL